MHDVHQKESEVRAELIGQLQSADGESITLTAVTTRGRYTSTSPFRHVPYLSRLYKNTGVATEYDPNPLTVPRDQMESIDLISPEEAAELKQPFERIGVDFDFNVGECRRSDDVATNDELPEETSIDLATLPPGQWCLLRLIAEQRGSFRTRTTYIGQLQRADDESITLTEVTTSEYRTLISPLCNLPNTNSVHQDLITVPKDEPGPVTVRLDRIECADTITAERAAKFKQPKERVGEDFYVDVAFDSGGKNVDPTSLLTGQWCQVRLHDQKRGSTQTHTTYIGQLQRTDDESITLAEVTTWVYHTATSPLRNVPYLDHFYSDSAPPPQNEPAPMTVRRDRITRVTPITAERAAQLKEPLKRFGVDFDFEQGSFELGPPVDRWGREVVAEQKTH
ncbi:MAG: hypothetical protein AABP62_21015 [Planctomycetota bacterium]